VKNVSDVANDKILYIMVRPDGTAAEYGDTGAKPALTILGGSLRSGVSDYSNNYMADVTALTVTDGAAPRIMEAEMTSQTVMDVYMSEKMTATLPLAKNAFTWVVGTQEVDFCSMGYILNFTQPSDGVLRFEVLEGQQVPAGMASTLGFITGTDHKVIGSTTVQSAGLIKDANNVANADSSDSAVDVTPPTGVPVEVAGGESAEDVPEVYDLSKNFPNPFNPTTTINYAVPVDGKNVEIIIYNMSGQKVRTLVNETKSAGYYQIIWDGTDNVGETVSSGVYLYRMVSGTFSKIDKMMFVK
jgi:hypothetical protein